MNSYHIWIKNPLALTPEQINRMRWSIMQMYTTDIEIEVQEDCHLVRITHTTIERATQVATALLVLYWFLTEVKVIPWYKRVSYLILEDDDEKPMEYLHTVREGDEYE